MAESPLDDQWIKIKRPTQGHDTLSWTTSISRTRVSTVDSLRFSENLDTGMIGNLGSLLSAVQNMKLKQFPADRIEEIRTVGVGETFSVAESKFDGEIIAVKRIRLHEDMVNANRTTFQRRLQAVLREIRIMHHPPLAHHPNIDSLLGYGWVFEEQRLSPFIAVELARDGSLRNYLKQAERHFKAKQIFAGDIAAGLMALHKCSIVHGDLKIDNVLIAPSLDRPSGAVAKVSDFGHSIILSPESEETAHYFGTQLYNAPEVRHQRSQPIPVEQLHKCDIWAFGLCVWEILADGQIYFQKSWRDNPAYCPPTSSLSSSMSIVELDNEPAPEVDDTHIFGRFDPCHLQDLAKSFVQRIMIPEMWFERKILLALFKHTLQIDPCQRLSDLSRLPVMNTWKNSAGGSFLQSQLASLAMASEMKYTIFAGHNNMHIPWAHQQTLLHDLETEAARGHPSLSVTEAAFQVMLCYINAFGTSRDSGKATAFLQHASSAGHILTRTFGLQIESGLLQGGETSRPPHGYAESLALGFRLTSQLKTSSSADVHFGNTIVKYPDYMSFKNGLVDLRSTYAEYGDITVVTVRNHRRQVRYNILEFAIRHNDSKLVEEVLSTLPGMSISKESLLHTAARCGNLDIVELLMRYWSSTGSFDASAPLYWLFCFSDTQIDRLVRLLQEVCKEEFKVEEALDRAMPVKEETPLHSQWPFKVQGTPLATAVSSGNTAAVTALLHLGANPLAPAFSPSEDQDHLMADFTPLHMAVKYNFPGIFDLLWHSAFPSGHLTMEAACSNQHLRRLPLACALSPLSNAERLAIHGSRYMDRLRETVSLISPMVQQQDPDGRTAVSQAIDMEDIDALEALLTDCPELATTRIKAPWDGSLYTYPLHLATQAFSDRESEELRRIILYILRLDPKAIDRPDASSFKPIHIAAMGSSTSLVKMLLEQGASLDNTGKSGRTPLHACNTAAMVQLLHSRGASLNQRDSKGMTAVHVAANKGSEDVLRSLIQCDAEINLTDDDGSTALHFATKGKHHRAAKVLLEAGAYVDAQDFRQQTALHLALSSEQYGLAHTLFELRANPFSQDFLKSSPFLIALASKDASILKEFLNHSGIHSLSHASLIEALFWAAANGEPATLAVYLPFLYRTLPRSEDINYTDAAVAVHCAAKACRVDLMEVLLSHGFNLESLDSEGNTPLISACKGKRIQPPNNADSEKRNSMCEYLLHKSANILAANKTHQTPFLIAHQSQDLPLMTLLLDHAVEANKQAPSSHLKSLLHYVLADSEEPLPTLPRQNVIRLFDDKTTGKELFDAALDNENWHLATYLLAGKFVEDLQANSIRLPREPQYSDDDGADIDIDLDITRQMKSAVRHFYAERKDWEMVAYLYRRGPTTATQNQNSDWYHQYLNSRRLSVEFEEINAIVFRFLWTGFGYDGRGRRRPGEEKRAAIRSWLL